MRKGLRKLAAMLTALLVGGTCLRAHGETRATAPQPVRMTVEVDWTLPPALDGQPAQGANAAAATSATPVELELTEGRVLGVVSGPAATALPDSRPDREPQPGGAWRIGTSSAGRVRARLEAPVGASLLVRAGGQVVQVPILAVLEGPQRTAPQLAVNVGVERLPWDAVEVSLPSGDGTVTAGSSIPVKVALNVLTPEPTEVALRLSAELRPLGSASGAGTANASGGGQAQSVWRFERRELTATNASTHPSHMLTVPAPQAEGTYVLEVRAAWEPLGGPDSTRLGRWLRRRRGLGSLPVAARRVTLAVVPSPGQTPGMAQANMAGNGESLADSIDLARTRAHRMAASGRAPLATAGRLAWPLPEAALADSRRRDLLRGLINRNGQESAVLPPADPNGLAWAAVNMKVPHPHRLHRLKLTVSGGHPDALGVALVAPGAQGPGGRPRVLLDACAAGLPILDGGPTATFSWPVWPDVDEPVVVLVNRSPGAAVRLGSIELTELTGSQAPLAVAQPEREVARALGVVLNGPHALDRFGGGGEGGLCDVAELADHLCQYLTMCGATSVVLPDRLPDRPRRMTLEAQAEEDCTGPDRLDFILRSLDRRGMTAWLSVDCGGTLPGLPAAGSHAAQTGGLVRLDRNGEVDGPAYHALSLRVREALKQKLAESIAVRKRRACVAGLLVELGEGPTLLGGPDTGFDDATFERFVRATGLEGARVGPGLSADDPGRFAARYQFLSGPGRRPWLTWRAKEVGALYAELAHAVDQAAPGALLAVATPGVDRGAAGEEARRNDLAGAPPHEAWAAVGLNFEFWPNDPHSHLVVLRGVAPSASDDLANDLATSPELDAQVAAMSGRGLLLRSAESEPGLGAPVGANAGMNANESAGSGIALLAGPLPDGPAGDEPIGHSLAALDARWVMLAASAIAGREERVRQFARVFRSLPCPDMAGAPAISRAPSGVSVRAIDRQHQTYLMLANDTPYPTRLETVLVAPAGATVADLGRGLVLAPRMVPGGTQLVIDLEPFGVAAARIGAPGVRVSSVASHPPKTALASIEAKKDELSRALSRLNRPARNASAGPPCPGFEPNIELTGGREQTRPNGWHTVGDASASATIDQAHPYLGQGSLRLEAATTPAGVLSDAFVPPGSAPLALRLWVRAERPDTLLRARFEGDQGGRPFVQQFELEAQNEWSAVAIPIEGLPAEGLDHARLRFELVAPGRVWIDELTLQGEDLTDAERRNARRTVLAALQAYREQRYADFARLAGSRWAHLAELDAGGPAARTSLRTREASALPPGRRLR